MLDAITGKPSWVRPVEGEGLLHFIDSGNRGRLLALDQHTGRKAWEMAGLRSRDAFLRVGGTGYLKT